MAELNKICRLVRFEDTLLVYMPDGQMIPNQTKVIVTQEVDALPTATVTMHVNIEDIINKPTALEAHAAVADMLKGECETVQDFQRRAEAIKLYKWHEDDKIAYVVHGGKHSPKEWWAMEHPEDKSGRAYSYNTRGKI